MEQAVTEVFTDEVLEEAATRFGAASHDLVSLGSFESFVYAYILEGHDFILKLTHSSHRSEALLRGEIDWLNYLASQDVPVAHAVPSQAGRYVEALPVGDTSFFATSFKRAKGEKLTVEAGADTQVIETWGRLLGRMHAATKAYQPAGPSIFRPHWFEDCYLIKARHLVPANQTRVHEQFKGLLSALYALPRDGESYGLVHNDVHPGNFLVENGSITLFDFDDCAYHWFAHDIAMPLYYALWHFRVPEAEKLAFTRSFMTSFMRGYEQENRLEPSWLSTIPLFLKLREADLYSVFHLKWDLMKLTEAQEALLRRYRHNIENQVPYVDFDFASLTVSS